MTKKKMEEENVDFMLDDSEELPMREVPKETTVSNPETNKVINVRNTSEHLVNPLRNERIIVRHIPKSGGIWGNDPRHVLAGGMAENAYKMFVVPRLSSGAYYNVLTKDEKAFMEQALGLEYNALSIHRKENNFWDDSNPSGIGAVRLNKGDNYLDLSNPEDYIRYKILLANKDFIAPSLQVLQDKPKVTYQFVIVGETEETKQAKKSMSTTMQCYKEYGKVEDNYDILKLIIETIDGRPISKNSKIEFLQTKINELIQLDSKLFLKTITDELLPTKVLISKSIDAGLISKRSNLLYLRSDNSPLCENGEESTLSVAAKYLNSPKHQELKFALEAKLK
jgi:hypothetical protein